jgi:type IV secretory pathway VirB2 component (pilin)
MSVKSKAGRAVLAAVAVATAALLIASQVFAADASSEPPSYAIANIAAVVMSLTVLAVACKRYRRS